MAGHSGCRKVEKRVYYSVETMADVTVEMMAEMMAD